MKAILSTLKSDLSLEKLKLTQNKHIKIVKLVSDPVNKGSSFLSNEINTKRGKVSLIFQQG